MQFKFLCLFRIFFLDIIIIRVLSIVSNDTNIPDIVFDLCPYADICNKTASQQLLGGNLISCCSSCNCDEDCGLRLDCCFGHLDKYKLEEKGKVACIDSVVRFEKYENKTVMKNGYVMIQTCGFDKVDTDSIKCNFTDSHGHSTFAPVSYFGSMEIFINKECAMCNSVNMSEIKEWNYLYRSEFVHLDSLDFHIQYSLIKHDALYYIPPTNENWLNKRCYNDIRSVQNCDLNNEWKYMCKHLSAIFRNSFGKIYDNVFCQLCTGIRIDDIGTTCQVESFRGQTGMPKLTMILNKAIIDPSDTIDMQVAKNTQKSKSYCHDDIEVCRMIHCPEGMFQTLSGCTYFALKWFVPWAVIQIKLVPKIGTMLEVSELLSLGVSDRQNPLTWMKVPCRRVGIACLELFFSSSEAIMKEDNETARFVTSFIARVWKSIDYYTGIDPSVTIPLYHKCATDIWRAKLRGTVYKFDAYFDRYSPYIQDGVTRKKKWPEERPLDAFEAHAEPALYKKVAE